MYLSSQKPLTLSPLAGFVVKTRVLESSESSKFSSKVFINICHDSQVPRPDVDFDPTVVFPLIIDNQWEIPIIVSTEKTANDKKGVSSFVYDCCINTRCFQWCQINSDLRSILIEWSIESIELLYNVTLDREYSIPKMMAKGELSKTMVSEDGLKKRMEELENNEALALLQSESEDDDQTLPDLMNISGSKKVLIEEVKESNKEKKVKKVKEVKDEKEEKEEKEVTDIVMDKVTDKSSNSTNSGFISEEPLLSLSSSKPLIEELGNMKITDKSKLKIEFQISFVNLQDRLLVKISTKVSPASLRLSYEKSSHSLQLQNLDEKYYFSSSTGNFLEIPLPMTNIVTGGVECFYVKREECLYVFV